MTVEIIPNYCHATAHEVQFMDFIDVGGHVFDGRPITQSATSGTAGGQQQPLHRPHRRRSEVQTVKAWYAYSDDPAWRDLMWYHVLMQKAGDRWEGICRERSPTRF